MDDIHQISHENLLPLLGAVKNQTKMLAWKVPQGELSSLQNAVANIDAAQLQQFWLQIARVCNDTF